MQLIEGWATQMKSNPADQPKLFQPPVVGEWIGCEGCWYQLGKPIGNGSFGIVYECVDEWGNQLAAKVMAPNGRPYEEIRDRWVRELTTLVTLRHPNITYLHQAFEYRTTFYLILERCDFTLQGLIDNPAIFGDIWLPYVARDILHALEFVHQRGYVHKDLHPGNIFIFRHQDRMVPQKDPVWQFKIADLGISRLEEEINQLGTTLAPWMLPPESIDSAQFGPLDRRTDVYHAGLLFLSLLLKRVPAFSREEILGGAPRALAGSLKSPLAPPIAKALRRHVNHRTESAIGFWREIKSVLGGSNPPFNGTQVQAPVPVNFIR